MCANELNGVDYAMLSAYPLGDRLGTFTNSLGNLRIKGSSLEGVPIHGFPLALDPRIDGRRFSARRCNRFAVFRDGNEEQSAPYTDQRSTSCPDGRLF